MQFSYTNLLNLFNEKQQRSLYESNKYLTLNIHLVSIFKQAFTQST